MYDFHTGFTPPEMSHDPAGCDAVGVALTDKAVEHIARKTSERFAAK